jgi:RHS repeat-associated protein
MVNQLSKASAGCGVPVVVQTILLAQELNGDLSSSETQPPILKAEDAPAFPDASWNTPNFGNAFGFALQYGVGKTLADVKIVKGPPKHEPSKREGGEADRGRARPALTKSQCEALCEALQLGYLWVPWRPLVPWWDAEYQPEAPGQLVLLAPLAKSSWGSSPARSLPSSVRSETSSNDTCITVQSRGQRARVRGTLAARTAGSTARSEAELTRGGAFRDDAGHMVRMDLARSGPCLPVGATCSQRFAYEWDEVGRLGRARRWDTAPGASIDDPLPGGTPAADLRYTYDAGDQRVIKHAVDTSGESFTLYVFASLELRRSQFGTDYSDTGSGPADYEASVFTVVRYLLANGVRLARLAYEGMSEVPEVATGTGAGQVNASVSQVHVFFELGDHLGSTSVVLDKATSELVERSTFQGYGATESDYRPGRWNAFREDYRFTGKEEDAEVGLTCFGKRYLNAYLGRWISADPLAIHAPGEADPNVYAYVSGSVLKNVDPLGLEEQTVDAANAGGASAADPAEHMGTGHEGASSDGSYLEATSDPEAAREGVAAGAGFAGLALCAVASGGSVHRGNGSVHNGNAGYGGHPCRAGFARACGSGGRGEIKCGGRRNCCTDGSTGRKGHGSGGAGGSGGDTFNSCALVAGLGAKVGAASE